MCDVEVNDFRVRFRNLDLEMVFLKCIGFRKEIFDMLDSVIFCF